MRDGQKTKEKLSRAALQLFVEQGITETTIRDIAHAAGVAEGTLYRHYESKEHLAWTLFADNFAAFAQELEQVQALHHRLRDKLAAMIRHFCRFYEQDPVLFNYLLLAQHAQLRKVTPDMPNPVAVVRDVIAQAMFRREIQASDPEVLAALVLGLVLQVATFRLYGRVTKPLTGLSDTLIRACYRVLNLE
ncbi:MAG: TetR/AcrR family transcriptional regulator [Deltaproteobacteria bacterium]|nr:TetR/AcrR family transcriptional regulator [Deltaproteobacteria bacterium]